MSSAIEFTLAAFLFALIVILNIWDLLHHTFNSDESQHLHIIWSWTRGLVQYRDLFDNHMPLFHIMFAPIAGMIGERATILYGMRFALLPMYFVTLWSTYQIGACLFSRRVGVWAAIAVAVYSGYRFIEFRTDDLWVPIWLLCITTLIGGAITFRRSLVAGVLLGFCFAVSMKSTLFLLSLALSAPLAVAVIGRKRLGKSWTDLAQCGFIFIVMTILIPAVIMLFFALKGVWSDFRYCVFDYNFVANQVYEQDLRYKHHLAQLFLVFPIVLTVFIWIAHRIARAAREPDLALGRALILLFCAAYYLLLNLWPPVSRTYLPIHPLACVVGGGALIALSDQLARFRPGIWRIFGIAPLPVIVALVVIAFRSEARPFWRDESRGETDLLRDILALTTPSDYVLDCKGETVFRPRCTRLILERITMRAIERGIVVDDAPQRCVETRTCVVATTMKERFSPATWQFIERNYLPVTNSVRVAGLILEPSAKNGFRSDFEVAVPASYKIISREGNVSGTLDGQLYDGARFLAAGRHTFESATSQNLVLLWAQAVDRHLTPFEGDALPGG